MARFDPSGYATFGHLLRAESRGHGLVSVDIETRTLYFLREDGTAHTAVTWNQGWKAERGEQVYPDEVRSCSDADEWRDLEPAAEELERVELELGHCWIEPVVIAGATWDVVASDQFGSGDGRRPGFVGAGRAWEAGDVLVYEDRGGRWFTMVVAGHAWTLEHYLVEGDDLLGPVFGGTVSEEHRAHATDWWCEVMGGPATYTSDRGGYEHMLDQHRGLGIDDEQRLRFVTLLSRAADLAGVPADPECRAALLGYAEWGSRLAVENSAPDATPVERAPMPRWGWGVAPPWSG